jgi:ketosteroid isomerase-like protein
VSYRLLAATLWLTLVVAGCAGTSLQSYKPKSNDETLVVAALMKIPTGINAKSVEVLMQPYDDALYVGNFHKYLGVAGAQASMRIGKPELRQAYTQVFRAVKEISMDVRDFRLALQGDRAVAEAWTEMLIKVEAGRKDSKQDVVRNEVTWRLKRGPMGWRIYEEIFH